MRRNKGSKYILRLSEDSMLVVKEQCGESVNPYRCLVQTR